MVKGVWSVTRCRLTGVRNALQNALDSAKLERATKHSLFQNCDLRLVQLKAQSQKAQAEKAGADMIRGAADRDYRELLKYYDSRTNQNEINSLSHEVEWLAREVTTATRNVLVAGEAVRDCEARMAEVERDRAVPQINFDSATERWSQIRTQLDDAIRQPLWGDGKDRVGKKPRANSLERTHVASVRVGKRVQNFRELFITGEAREGTGEPVI
jgi:hypothetical protein